MSIAYLFSLPTLLSTSGENPIGPLTDIHAVCDLTKTWFRVLAEPLFTPSSYHDVIESMSEFPSADNDPGYKFDLVWRLEIDDFDLRLSKIRAIVHDLPQPNFDLLKRVAEHLDR
jgi:GTPase-activating protein BEM2